MMATTNPEATAVGRSSTELQTEGRRKRAVITGSNGGMGRALARAFGETMDLVLTDIARRGQYPNGTRRAGAQSTCGNVH